MYDTSPLHTVPSRNADAEGFYLPELPRLLPVAYHPKAAQIEFRSNGWVRRSLGECFASEEQLLKLLRERVGLYGPLIAPKADEQRVLDLTDFYHFVGLIDNLAVDHSGLGANIYGARKMFEKIMTDFGAGTGAASPFGRAAADLWQRISPGLTTQQIGRFRASMETFLGGITAELPFQLGGVVPDYDTYMAIRIDSFGCDFVVLLNEYAMAVDMSEFAASPEFGEVYAHGMRQMILVNDVLSLRKEHGDPMNAVRVLCHHYGLTLQQAVDQVCELAELHERAYAAARDAVLGGPEGDRRDVRAYLDGLDHLIAGAQEFEYLTPRYFGDGSVWDGSTSGWVSFTSPTARLRS
ncbi:terpene synthase family protein [Streptomyces gobiensis]|uniref:terpene synthase family protein n=1 Tax=Streptomyces gobiensis TaxID=2875706 RepID=UPI001E626DCE|nr:terpene synthase family protein [Streptomyces gobiensis]UGY94656.1 terpene synthase family protein [Streptomyces gobiensis]